MESLNAKFLQDNSDCVDVVIVSVIECKKSQGETLLVVLKRHWVLDSVTFGYLFQHEMDLHGIFSTYLLMETEITTSTIEITTVTTVIVRDLDFRSERNAILFKHYYDEKTT